jgi:UDP-glucose 4-epimerase
MTVDKALVTGGAGFIGSHLVEVLLKEDCEVIVLDDLSSGRLENLRSYQDLTGFSFIKGSILDIDLLKKVMKDIDVVYHQAAIRSVPKSIEMPSTVNEVNVTGTLRLLNQALDAGVDRFLYASSSSVYGEAQALPKVESLPTVPTSPYGTSKLAAEHYCRVFNKVYGLKTVSLRYFNVYGPRQTYGPYSGVIILFIGHALRGKPPTIFGDGNQTRDFTHVDDVIRANLLASELQAPIGEAINIGAGRQTSINVLAQIILELTGRIDLTPIYTSPRPGDIRHALADISQAKKLLGYEPRVSLHQGLDELVKWYQGPGRDFYLEDT